eukprot:10624103-Alexandrium_andersonii.AAC.1
MSASLVGSEMCIRDSHPPGNYGGTCASGQGLVGRRRLSALSWYPVWWKNCLLYTSDAADDM